MINNEIDFLDIIWLGWVDFLNFIFGIGYFVYFYSEGNFLVGKFDFVLGLLVIKEDFLVIDFINEDISIVEGWF